MKCSIKNCKSYSKSGCNVHFFGFPLNDENCLDKWIVAVGKPNWKPKKTSRICSLHFSESDIIQSMGYHRFNLRKNAVPNECSSTVVERETTNAPMSKSEEVCNAANISDNETSVLDKSATWDNSCLNNNVSTATENDGSSTFDARDPNQSAQKAISHLGDKKHSLTQTDPQEMNATSISNSVNSSEVYVLCKNAAWDHDYSKNVLCDVATTEHDGSSIRGAQNSNQARAGERRTIVNPVQTYNIIKIGSKDVVVPVSYSSTDPDYKIRKEDYVNATKKINELSKTVKDMKLKNRTLQQKLRRYNEKVTLIRELFDRLEEEKLISGDALQLVKKQLEYLTLRTYKNKVKNKD